MAIGNFPQAFTHVAHINCAMQIAIAKRGRFSESHQIIKGSEDSGDTLLDV